MHRGAIGGVALLVVSLAAAASGCALSRDAICGSDCLEEAIDYQCQHMVDADVLGSGFAMYSDICVTGRDPSVRRVRDAVASGRLAIDRDALARCLAAGLWISFEDVFAIDGDCYDIWVPRTPIGGACDTSFACIDGFCARTDYARSRPDYVAGGCGVCAPRGHEGAPCDHHGWVGEELECEAGLVCDDVASGASGMCLHRPRAGESCVSGSRVTCVDGLACVRGTCTTPLATGAACAADDVCADLGNCIGRCSGGAECASYAPCADGSTCAHAICVAPLPIGARCGGLASCEGGSCHAGTCSAGAQLGERCDDFYCADGLVCDGTVCVGPARAGEACIAPTQCPPGYGCDEICFEWLLPDDACTTSTLTRCVPGTECRGGLCARLPAMGEPCTGGCARGECLSGVCASAPIGTMCSLGDPICGDGVCAFGDTCAAAPTSCMGWDACPLEQFCTTEMACAPICYVGR